MNMQWIIMPLSGGVIGYFTNWLAIKMLFRPLHAKKLFGKTLPFTPGLIPKEREKLTEKIAKTLMEYVLTEEAFEKNFKSIEMKENIKNLIHTWRLDIENSTLSLGNILDNYVDLAEIIKNSHWPEKVSMAWPQVSLFLQNKLQEQPDLEEKLREGVKEVAKENLGAFLGLFVSYNDLYDKIKDSLFRYLEKAENREALLEIFSGFMENQLETGTLYNWIYEKKLGDWLHMIPEEQKENIETFVLEKALLILEKGAKTLVNTLNIEKMILDEINKLETEALEKITLEVVDRELKMITWLGGILGAIIGFFPLLWEYVAALL